MSTTFYIVLGISILVVLIVASCMSWSNSLSQGSQSEFGYNNYLDHVSCDDLWAIIHNLSQYRGDELSHPLISAGVDLLCDAIKKGGWSPNLVTQLEDMQYFISKYQRAVILDDMLRADSYRVDFWMMWEEFLIEFQSVCG